MKNSIEWVGISGSREINGSVIRDIRSDVDAAFSQGKGLVIGGALGTDYEATKRALELDPEATRTKVIIPTSLAAYKKYFDKQVEHQRVSPHQVTELFDMLNLLKRQGALTEMQYACANTESFHARNSQIVGNVRELFAYSVNHSSGTRNTINQAKSAGLAVTVRDYTL